MASCLACGHRRAGIFLLELLTLDWVSLGSILAALSLPFLTLWLLSRRPVSPRVSPRRLHLAVYKHRANIQRLRTGIEPKVCMPWQKRAEDEKRQEIEGKSDRRGHESTIRDRIDRSEIENPYVDSLWEEYAEIDIADVVVDIDAPGSAALLLLSRSRNPAKYAACRRMCVHIPFAGRETLGYVLARRKLASNDPLCGKLKRSSGSWKTRSRSMPNNCI